MKYQHLVLGIVVLEVVLILGYSAIFRHTRTPQHEIENKIRNLNQPSHISKSRQTNCEDTEQNDILPGDGLHSRAKYYFAKFKNVLANWADGAETQQPASHDKQHNQNSRKKHSQLALYVTEHNENFPEEHSQLAPHVTEHNQNFPEEHPQLAPHVTEHNQNFPEEHPQLAPHVTEHNQNFPEEHPQLAPHVTEHNQNFPEEHLQLAPHVTERNENFPEEHSQLAPQDKQQKQTSTGKHSNRVAADPDKVHSPYMHSLNMSDMCKENKMRKKHEMQLTPDIKLIMYWQEGARYYIKRPGGLRQMCTLPTAGHCEITWDQSYRTRADAIVFHASRLFSDTLPFQKLPGQIWVARALESPIHWHNSYRSRAWRGVFNLTFTYRPDSDLFSPVGALVKTPPPDNVDYRQIALHKSRSVAWFVSDCDTRSKREKYIEEMRKYIDTDIYGKCGTLDCSKDERGSCFRLLSEKYFFYLAFENSLFNYYVTEKIFNKYGNLGLDRYVIPVVRGATNYGKYFPEGTFIDAADFKTPKDLALYLKKLSDDLDTYTAMLARKDLFSTSFCTRSIAWCKLCDMLHDKNLKPKYYENLGAWWDQEQCVEPRDI